MNTLSATYKPLRGWNIALWTAQIIVAGMFLMAGGTKVFTPAQDLINQMHLPDAGAIPFFRFIGIAELAGAIGLIVPALFRIKPILTPIAAIGILVIMILAAALHISKGEMAHLPVVFALALLSAFIAWGRFKKVKIPAKQV